MQVVGCNRDLCSQWEVTCCHQSSPAQAALPEIRMVTMAAAVLKKGLEAGLVIVKDACSCPWSGSMFLIIPALP